MARAPWETAVKITDRATRTTAARFVWGGLTLLFLVLLFMSRSRQSSALNTQIQDAQARANGYANTTVAQAATDDTPGGVIEFLPKEFTIALQGDVFTDPTVARVRVWDAEGLLLASSDPSEDVGGVVAANDPALNAALEGTTSAQVAQQPFTYSTVGSPAEPTDLLQVFAPLRVKDQVRPAGAVQVDYLYAKLKAAAADPWSSWTRLAFALTIACALLLLASMLRAPIRAEERRAMALASPTRKDADTSAASSATEQHAEVGDERSAELAEELQAAREQLQQATEAYAFLEARMKDGPGVVAQGPDVEAATARIAELEDSLKRAEAEAALARTSAVSQEELDQVRHDADERVADLERRVQEESTKAAEAAAGSDPELEALRAQVAETEARAQQAEASLAAAQADVLAARKEAEAAKRGDAKEPALSRAPIPAASPAETGDPVDLIAELEAKVAEAEVRAKEAEEEALRLTPEANDLRARLARTAARKKLGPTG